MIAFPNAKINIGLNILRRRADGYHDIETVMYPIGWHDILEAVPAKSGETTLTVSGRHVDCPTEKNLVMKAYRRMQQEVELPEIDIYLHKIIPDGAGLGGGSADAAFMLKMLNEMFALGFDEHQLAGMAADIGSDCPFFIYNRPMIASGRGEILSDIDSTIGRYAIAVVKPADSVSTKEAYSAVKPEVPEIQLIEAFNIWQRQIREPGNRGNDSGLVKNDFEPSVFANHQILADTKRKMYELGAVYASMSGSGSAIYGLFDEPADKLSGKIETAFAGMAHHITPSKIR